MKILIIKLSSMGDVIHALPAITDACRVNPELKIDWVVDQGFAEIPSWHPAINKVIPLELRAWRGNKFKLATLKKIKKFIYELRAEQYDMVIDAQGLLKSAIITFLAKGTKKAGYSFSTAREKIAAIFYRQRISVAPELHAIVRLRQLFAKALGYPLQAASTLIPQDYGVNWQNFATAPSEPYVVFLHGTTWVTKHWPDDYWHQLAELAVASGYKVKVTWANAIQKKRAHLLAMQVEGVEMLPHLDLTTAAAVIASANAVIAVDTGFGHLAAAQGKLVIGLFGATDPNKTGFVGTKVVNLDAAFHCSPCLQKSCRFQASNKHTIPCMVGLYPYKVWDTVTKCLADLPADDLPTKMNQGG